MTRFVFLPMLTVLAAGLGLAQQPGICASQTLYARLASEGPQVSSPDGKKNVKLALINDGQDTLLKLQTQQRTFRTRLPGWHTEILWAPDSSRFAVNQTTGGGGIGQEAYVFVVARSGLRRINVSPPVKRAFGHPAKCEVEVPPNTAVLQWLDTNRVLVVAEIVNVSICKHPGAYKAYELSLRDVRVHRIYTQAQTKARFPNALGCELQEVRDESSGSVGKR